MLKHGCDLLFDPTVAVRRRRPESISRHSEEAGKGPNPFQDPSAAEGRQPRIDASMRQVRVKLARRTLALWVGEVQSSAEGSATLLELAVAPRRTLRKISIQLVRTPPARPQARPPRKHSLILVQRFQISQCTPPQETKRFITLEQR